MDDSQELLAQICPPIGENGLRRSVFLRFAVGAESARRRDKIHALLKYRGKPRPTQPSQTDKKPATFAEVR
jgi:hypothetical protein